MSYLTTILVELHNCLNVEKDIPLVWSREFQKKLALNTDHWAKVQRRDSYVSRQVLDDDGVRVPYHDNQDELEAANITYNDEYEEYEEEGQELKTKKARAGHTLYSVKGNYWFSTPENALAAEEKLKQSKHWSPPSSSEEEEDAGAFYTGSRGRYQDMERDAMNNPEDPARDDYAGFGGDENSDRLDPRNEMGEDDYEDYKTKWGQEYHRQDGNQDEYDLAYDEAPDEENEESYGEIMSNLRREHRGREQRTSLAKEKRAEKRSGFASFMADEEEEEQKAQFNVGGERSEYDDDCPECFGTGHDFPRLKDDCPACNGSGKADFEARQRELGRADAHAFGMPQEEEQEDVQGNDLGPKQQRELNANPDEADPENVAVDDQYGLDDPNDQEDFGDEGLPGEDAQEEWDDPDYQGVIRVVPNSHLVFKRQQEDGTFDELWQYNLGDDFQKELDTRRSVLAGTDIPINKMKSPDNTQSYELWTIGNGQMLQIKGLPN